MANQRPAVFNVVPSATGQSAALRTLHSVGSNPTGTTKFGLAHAGVSASEGRRNQSPFGQYMCTRGVNGRPRRYERLAERNAGSSPAGCTKV